MNELTVKEGAGFGECLLSDLKNGLTTLSLTQLKALHKKVKSRLEKL